MWAATHAAGMLVLLSCTSCDRGAGRPDASPLPPARVADDGAVPLAITPGMLGAQGVQTFDARAAVDGDVGRLAWSVDPGGSITIDTGARLRVTRFAAYALSAAPYSYLGLRYFDGGEGLWEPAGSVPLTQTSSGWIVGTVWQHLGAHRFWRIEVGGDDGPASFAELALWTDGGSYQVVPLTPAVLSQSNLAGYYPAGIADGDTRTYGWHTDDSPPAWLQVDLGQPRAVKQVNVYREFTTVTYEHFTYYNCLFSDDTITWGYGGALATRSYGWTSSTWMDVGAHRYWRCATVDHQTNPLSSWMTELEFLTPVEDQGDEPRSPIPLTPSMLRQEGLTGYVPEGVVDGDTSSFGWHTDASDAGARLQVDLGEPRAVTSLRYFRVLDTTPYFRARYGVEYSDDAAGWTSVATVPATDAGAVWVGWNSASWPDAGAHRYWRLVLLNTPGPAAWISELVLEEQNGPVPEETGSPVALNPSMLTEAGLTGYVPEGIVDGDTASYGWHTDAAVAGAWLQVDLGEPQTVVELRYFRVLDSSLYFRARYAIESSDDAARWTPVATTPAAGTMARTGWNAVSWPDAGAHRYWRLVLQNTPGPAAWISELALNAL